MRRAGTFSFEEKVQMLEFLSCVACNPDDNEYYDYIRPRFDEIVPRLNINIYTSGGEDESI